MAAPKQKKAGKEKTQTPSKKSAASASSKMAEEDEALIANLKSLADSLLSASNPTTPTNLKTLQSMCDLVKGSTSSMTSVPIPLKVYCGKKEVEEEQQEKKKKKKDDTPQIEEPTYQQQFSSLLHSWYTSSLDAGGISLKKSTSKKRDEECVFYSSLSALLSILAMTLPATIEDKEDTVRLQLAKKKVDEEKALEEKTGKKGDAEKKMVKNKAEEVKNESSDKNGNGNGNEDKKKEEKIDPSLLDHSTPLLPVLYYRLMHGAIIGSMKNPPMESSRENSKEGGELLEWGGEYLRALSFQIGEEYARITTEVDEMDAAAKPPSPKKAKSPKRGGMSDEKEDEEQERPPPLKPSTDDLYGLVDIIVPSLIRQGPGSGIEAVDLLLEVNGVERLAGYMSSVFPAKLSSDSMADDDKTDESFLRLAPYLLKSSMFEPDESEREKICLAAGNIVEREREWVLALRIVLMRGWNGSLQGDGLNAAITGVVASVDNELDENDSNQIYKQLAIILGRHRSNYEFEEGTIDNIDDDLAEELNGLVGNESLSETFANLGRELDVVDAKTPEDIYKSHLADTAGSFLRRSSNNAPVDSARANLSSTFVNAFVNAGFGSDKLMTTEGNEWLYKNKDHGMMSAAASLGTIYLWNVDEGLNVVDKFLYSKEEYIKAGAALAVGILSCGVRNDADPALALLSEYVSGASGLMKTSSCVSLGIAYSGTHREDVGTSLQEIVEGDGDDKVDMVEVGLAALSLGMIHVGSCDGEVGAAIVGRLMELSDDNMEHSHARFVALGLGLVYLGKGDMAEPMVEAVKTITHKIGKLAANILVSCAYCATGNVEKVQQMLHECAEHIEEAEAAEHQAVAVLGIALITMNEEIGHEMAMRSFEHLLHFCEAPIKRAVPLAIALLHISNPDYAVVDQLSRLSHDTDVETAQNAIMGLGLISAGTNNSRVAGLLRGLSEFYTKDANLVFCVRIAQGLLHQAKGLISLSPYHSDRLLICPQAIGGILTVLHACMDMKATLLDKSHYLLYFLTCAMNPRMLVTVKADEVGTTFPVTARVGQAVDTIGKAGNPKAITGFQTHTTPVLLQNKERSELGDEEWLSVTPIMEGLVLVKKNPDFVKEEVAEEKKSN